MRGGSPGHWDELTPSVWIPAACPGCGTATLATQSLAAHVDSNEDTNSADFCLVSIWFSLSKNTSAKISLPGAQEEGSPWAACAASQVWSPQQP